MKRNLATKKQIQLIQIGRQNLGMPRSLHVERMQGIYGKSSCKDLTVAEASDYIDYLTSNNGLNPERLAKRKPTPTPHGKITQDGYIHILWVQRSQKFGETEEGAEGLSLYILAHTSKQGLPECTKKEKSAIITRLKEEIHQK